jgi:hypothetical protein
MYFSGDQSKFSEPIIKTKARGGGRGRGKRFFFLQQWGKFKTNTS